MEYTGSVKWYDPDKAYGFVAGAPQGDVFVHRNSIVEVGREELIEGQEVRFQVRPSQRGFEAFDVVVTRESSLPPRPRKSQGGGPRRGADRGFDRGFDSRSERGPRTLPRGPVTCVVTNVDRDDRFLFVRSEREDFEVFVHSSLFRDLPRLRKGDTVRVTVEQGDKGLRARTLELL
jgi:CspA family cold shock protein